MTEDQVGICRAETKTEKRETRREIEGKRDFPRCVIATWRETGIDEEERGGGRREIGGGERRETRESVEALGGMVGGKLWFL